MLAYFEALVNFLWGLPIIVIILGTGFYFTFKTGFFQVFHLKHIFSETICKIIKKGNKAEGEGKGLITPFEAVATAIGGRKYRWSCYSYGSRRTGITFLALDSSFCRNDIKNGRSISRSLL